MNFRYWKPPGVSDRMRSENLDVSISGDDQTVGGDSGWPSERLIYLMAGTVVPWE
jgi:hypothetical protein